MSATDAQSGSIEGFDSMSATFLADPGPELAEARRSCPVFHDEKTDAWLVTRYEDVHRVLTDHKVFTAESIRVPIVAPPEFEGRLPMHDLYATTILFLDPPKHTRLRRLLNKTLTPKRMADEDPTIRRISNEEIDKFIGDGRCDLMNQYTEPLLWRAVVEMFGMPEEAIPRLKELRKDMFALLMETHRGNDGTVHNHDIWGRIADGYDYFRPMLDERRANPRNDMTTVLLDAVDDDGNPAFTDDDVILQVMGTAASSTDTTSILICNTVLLLQENPDVAAEVRANPELIVRAIDESLRRYSPAVTMSRVATHDIELSGTTIPAGATVGANLPSANHDEQHFPDPERFDIHRENLHEQLGFGTGRHFCLGAPLARYGARAALETLYERIPDIRIPEQEYEWVLGLSRQYEKLIVEWD